LYDYASSRFSAAFSEKSARDFSQLPRDLFAKQNFWRKLFQQKILDPVLFHNVSAQNPPAGKDSRSAPESEFLVAPSAYSQTCAHNRDAR
jgi:hypothetical protein